MTESVSIQDTTERQESLGGVFGIGLGLLFIALCVLGLVLYGPREVAAAELLGKSFEFDSDPPSLGVRSPMADELEVSGALVLQVQALTLAQGEQVFTFSAGGELDVAHAEILPSKGGGPGMHGKEEFEAFDMSLVKVEESNSLPARFYLVRFPTARAEATLNSQFRRLAWKDLSEINAKGGSSVVGGDKLRWAGFEADWVRQRRFIEGGAIRDTLRVNLSLGQECWIGYAIWPENVQGSEEVLSALLKGLRPIVLDEL